jgi:hypothetical protein
MNWIRESNDYNSDEDTFQDFNYWCLNIVSVIKS